MQTALHSEPVPADDSVRRILAMSRAAEVCAVNSEWSEVADIHARRRELIDAYFDRRENGPDVRDAGALREGLTLDRRILEMATGERRKLSALARTVTRGRHAVREYATASGAR